MSPATPALIVLTVLVIGLAAYAAWATEQWRTAKDRAEAFRFTGLTVLDWLEAEVAKHKKTKALLTVAEQQVEVVIRRRTQAAMDLIEAQMRRDDAEKAVDFLLARIQRLEEPKPRRRVAGKKRTA